MQKYTLLLATLLVLNVCNNNSDPRDKRGESITKNEATPVNTPSLQDKIDNLKDSENNEIIVVAHRGDWRNAPENSLPAIQNCIDMGIDMVEIDISETKDGQLVLMHDNTVDRTTTGKGKIKNWTLDSLRTLRLVDGLGIPTQHKIPTLKEALELSKDKILINLDKSYNIFDKCYKIALETGTLHQIIIKGNIDKATLEKDFGVYLDEVFFMPIVNLPSEDAETIVEEYMASKPPIAIEFTVLSDETVVSDFAKMRKAGTSIWVNSLWAKHNMGHDDEKAVLDPTIYDWFIEKNIDIIQTDRPKLLLKYLRSRGLHR